MGRNSMAFYAHSLANTLDKSRWQLLGDHLNAVAELTKRFASEACPGADDFALAAYVAALLHDLGKYRDEFQKMLVGGPKGENTRHKQAGAARAERMKRSDIAFAIAGHHGGLPDRDMLIELIRSPGGRDVAELVWPRALADCPTLNAAIPPANTESDLLAFDVLTRLLFSCLVDADWADTSAFYRNAAAGGPEPGAPSLDAAAALRNVQAFIAARALKCRDPRIAAIRNEILLAAIAAAPLEPGIFSMTVPTGGGKTLSALAFALAHAARHGLRRIIYVAPYLSIIEQNAREIRRALAAESSREFVFEHHSLSEPPGSGEDDEANSPEITRLAEAWTAPVVITTSVQFFESLFSNQPSRCRKLHNIARSVVILDECQTLPPGLVAPTCSLLGEFSRIARCSIVLCTATQPAWSRRADLPEGLSSVREIMPEGLQLFARLRRARIAWPSTKDAAWSWNRVATTMLEEPAALCIVNSKRAAAAVYDELQRHGAEGAFHLSTAMCPAHRLEVLDEVRRRLLDGEHCRLISTQLVEAGVDVDFPLVLREMAPLESVIQAAGRSNREGLLNHQDGSPGGRVIVFRSVDGVLPPDRWYKAGTAVLEQDFLHADRQPDVSRPEEIAEYFRRLYRTGNLDANGLEQHRKGLRFQSVADGYRLIDDDTTPVVIATWKENADEVAELLERLRSEPGRMALRRLARYQVNFRRHELERCGEMVAQDSTLRVQVWWGPYDEALGVQRNGSSETLIV